MMNPVQNELMHYGILGMKWGKRSTRGRPGPGIGITAKRQIAISKGDLKTLDNGGHLSVGLTKKRQEAFDKRDRAAVEKSISKSEANLVKKAAEGKTIIDRMKTKMNESRRKAVQKDIDSLTPFIEKGIVSKKGKVIVSAKEIKDSIAGLEKVRDGKPKK